MKQFFRFRLSTLFLVITVVAVSIGIKLVFAEMVESTSSMHRFLSRLFSQYIWGDIPLYLVCALGIKWTLCSKEASLVSKRLVVTALATVLSWRLLVAPLVTFGIAAVDLEAVTQLRVAGWMALVSQLVVALCWLLMILGYFCEIGREMHDEEQLS